MPKGGCTPPPINQAQKARKLAEWAAKVDERYYPNTPEGRWKRRVMEGDQQPIPPVTQQQQRPPSPPGNNNYIPNLRQQVNTGQQPPQRAGGTPQTENINLSGGAQNLQLPIYTPEQGDIMNFLLAQGAENFDPALLEQRERSLFNKRTLPTLAERFSQMGQGSHRSSAFQGELGEAGSDLEERLAQIRANAGQSQLEMGLQPSYENVFQAGSPGFLGGLSESMVQNAPQMIEQLMQFYNGISGNPAYKLNNDQTTGYRVNSVPVTGNTGNWGTILQSLLSGFGR